MADLLTVSGLTVTAGTALVHGIDFSLAAGERVGVIGASGSGKTLTCLAVAGLLPPELRVGGSIRMDGVAYDLVDAPERQLARLRGDRVGMVFQEPMTALNPTMRIGRQVAEVMRLHTSVGRREAAAATRELLAATGLPEPERITRSYPHQLSGGQRQRVMLAIALANSPDLLICDEPTTALDVTVQATVLALIDRRVREENAALLFISHNLAVVAEVCDRVLVMYQGRIVEAGSVEQILTDPRHPHTLALLADAELSAT
jgi:ABC-type dipeptide/oligopeptide/nickel transport system ATPase component